MSHTFDPVSTHAARIVVLCIAGWLVGSPASLAQPSFVNWESAPVHPIDLSPDGSQIVVANLPAARLDILAPEADQLHAIASIPVGLDPVTARYYTNDEVWVVCHISDAINIVDLPSQRVIEVIPTADGPSDVVFAGNPLRAYVSCAFENAVQVIDPITHETLETIPIKGQRPKSLATAPDGSKVYVAVFESGNASTILAPRFGLDFVPGSAVDFHEGPYQGQNPPPNAGARFDPPIAEHLTEAPPRVGLIVKKNAVGRWMDDNEGDWTEYVTGSKAPLSGRSIGWDMPDRDLAIIDTKSHSVAYVYGLMNICMNVAVHPATALVTVIGTDANNEVRFEPVLNGRFLDVEIALIDPSSLATTTMNLNPHLTDQEAPLPEQQRKLSIGDPRHLVWTDEGSVAYVAGMGSNNLIKINTKGQRLESLPIGIEGGPAALAMDSRRNRLYVFQRFDNSVSALDTHTDTIVTSIQLFDPTPAAIRKGRPHFYDTQKTSGTGHLSCASCHVDGRFDRLAWDLGTPEGASIPVDRELSFETDFIPAVARSFHPMKGPMMTMTMQDIIGHEPLHWRGDRRSIEAFNPTFTDLQAAERELSHVEMAEFKAFLETLHFPPNRYRTFSNGLSNRVPIPDHRSLGRDGNGRAAGEPFGFGDAINGQQIFVHGTACSECHTQSTGLGPHMRFRDRVWQPLADGPLGERHVSLVQQARAEDLPFKIASLRGLSEKVGANFLGAESDVGFGFRHDGSVDSLVRFIQDGFNVVEDRTTANLIAFLLSFTGVESSPGRMTLREDPPGLPSKDTHAAVGKQFLLSTGDEIPPLLHEAISNVVRRQDPIDLIAYQQNDQATLAWRFSPETKLFHPDGPQAPRDVTALVETASPNNSVLFMAVPPGTGQRMAHDWDLDGTPNYIEQREGFDPQNSRSTPENLPPIIHPIGVIALSPGEPLDLHVSFEDGNTPPDPVKIRLVGEAPTGAALNSEGHLTWKPPESVDDSPWKIEIEIEDSGTPPMKSRETISVHVLEKQDRPSASAMQVSPDETIIRWNIIPGQSFQISHSASLVPPLWFPLTPPLSVDQTTWETRHERKNDQAQFYRIETLTHEDSP